MKFLCFPRMRLWHSDADRNDRLNANQQADQKQQWQPCIDQKRKTRKGAMTLVSVFLFFIFSTLGLSMLYFSQIYLKLSAYKKN